MIQQNTYSNRSKNNRFVSVCPIHKPVGWRLNWVKCLLKCLLAKSLTVCLDVRVFHLFCGNLNKYENGFCWHASNNEKKIIDIKVDKIGVQFVVTHINRVNDVTGWWIVVIRLFASTETAPELPTILVAERGCTQILCM